MQHNFPLLLFLAFWGGIGGRGSIPSSYTDVLRRSLKVGTVKDCTASVVIKTFESCSRASRLLRTGF